MEYLVRKINLAKWKCKIGNDIGGDAITGCLRTSSNKISVWIAEDDSNYYNAILAMISTQERFETVDFVIFKTEDIKSKGLGIEKTPGKTPVKDLIDTHVDLVEITYSKLGHLKDIIEKIIEDEKTIRITRAKSIEIVKRAIETQQLLKEDLNDGLKKHL